MPKRKPRRGRKIWEQGIRRKMKKIHLNDNECNERRQWRIGNRKAYTVTKRKIMIA